MYFTFAIHFWRRKLSVLLVAASLVLLALWTWAFFGTTKTFSSKDILNQLPPVDKANQHAYLIQKLISQANRVLRYEFERKQLNKSVEILQKNNWKQVTATNSVRNKSSSLKTGILRFVKPTKSPTIDLRVLEASTQTLALLARRRKAPAVGETHIFEEERLRILENQQRVKNAVLEDLAGNNNMDDDKMLTSTERHQQYEHELQRMGVPMVADIGPDGPLPPKERLVHLDLKGAAPKLSFLKHLLPMLKTLGATGLLIEYEDMFPYGGELAGLAAGNAYTPDELKDFLETATLHGLSVMPLVQTFGHMEFVLKLQSYAHLREIPDSPQSICPSQKDSMSLVEAMLSQVIDFHLRGIVPGSATNSSVPAVVAPSVYGLSSIKMSHIHIGCDEVLRMAECDLCRQRSRNGIFLNHVINIASFIKSRWPGLGVVIWDDMMRSMSLSEMLHSNIGSYVEPMVWVYVNDIYHFIQPQLWEMYSNVFATAWAASAFKGAFGETLMVPPLQRHLENNIRWLAVISKEGGRFSRGFRGLALTGWQRYDHFAALCELLPIGIPSLITSLSTVSKGYFATNPKDNSILKILDCVFHPDSRRSGHPWIELHLNSHHSQLFAVCNYPGHMIYKYALRLFEKLTEVQNYLMAVQDRSAWMSEYNVRHNFSAPTRVRSLTANTPELIHDLTGMAREAQQLMFDVFDQSTIAEFIEQQIFPVIQSLRKQLDNADVLLRRNHWPLRPLPYAPELVDWQLMIETTPKAEHMKEG